MVAGKLDVDLDRHAARPQERIAARLDGIDRPSEHRSLAGQDAVVTDREIGRVVCQIKISRGVEAQPSESRAREERGQDKRRAQLPGTGRALNRCVA